MSTVQQEVYETIRGQLLSGRFRPGQKLGEEKLAAELGVNRNPVREALLKLAGEGFVERHAGLGCRVAKIDVELLSEAWQLRESVEGMAARLAARRMQPVEMMRLEHEFSLMKRFASPKEFSSFAECDNTFHRMLVEFSGNRALREVWRQYLVRIVTAQAALWPAAYVPRTQEMRVTILEHATIVKALQSRNGATAERAVRRHLSRGLRDLRILANRRSKERVN
jgi:DNA-binding GntR family transcriptional regulator